MHSSRIDKLLQCLAQEPGDPFTRYALALEYDAIGKTDDAVVMLEALAHDSPEYVPTFQLLGSLLPKLSRIAEAKAMLETGIRKAGAQNDGHARSEMQDALDALE